MTTPNGESKMSKCLRCGSDVKPHVVGGFVCDLTLAHRNTKAPPVSSVPGEAGPYPSASKTCEHIQHGINAGVCLQCQLIPDYRELVNHGYFMCRASMKAEMESAVSIIEQLLLATKESEPQDHEVENAIKWLKARGSSLADEYSLDELVKLSRDYGAELEAAREGLRNAKVAMTCAGNSREPYDIGRYLRDGLVAVDAALTPSKEPKP